MITKLSQYSLDQKPGALTFSPPHVELPSISRRGFLHVPSTMPTRRHAGGSSLIRAPSLHVSSLRMSGAIIIINIIIVPVFICLPGVDTFWLLYSAAPPLLGENMRK